MLATEIRNNWAATAMGYAAVIPSLTSTKYEAWTIKNETFYGVAFPVSDDTVISEAFAGARFYTDRIILDGGQPQNAVMLIAKSEDIEVPFSALCAELVEPGIRGEFREEISNNPVAWWMQWKELLGNKNVDERVYDALGELMVLGYLAEQGEPAVWNGPDSVTYDIDCDQNYYEVKSTVVRSKRQITLSNHFQLDPPAGKSLYIVLCQFESAQRGYNIDGQVEYLSQLGYSKFDLNQKLEKLGLEQGKSARKRCYDLHAMIIYEVNEKFPAIRESSFVGGLLPPGVETITYTLSLDGVEGTKITR